MIGLLVLALLTPPHATINSTRVDSWLIPVARFTVTCPALQCTLDASGSTGGIRLYTWTANGKTESHAFPISKVFFPRAGTWPITLRVTDSTGHYRTLTKQVVVPSVVKAPPPVKPDTVRITDTLRLPPVHDTVRVTKHDTLGLVATLPQPLPGSTTPFLHVDSLSNAIGNPTHVYLFVMIGTIFRKADGSVEAYRPSVAVPNVPSSMSLMALKSQGVYPTLAAAVNALHAPAPAGWVP